LSRETYDILRESYMFGTHLVIVVRRFFWVPACGQFSKTQRGQRDNAYEFNGNLLVIQQVCAFKEDAE
jgi:hypothetical protein